MTEDNKTILANLAITIAEKEASIQRLTNRINELIDQCNALNNERHRAEMVVTPQQRTTLGQMVKDGMLTFNTHNELETLLGAQDEIERLGKILTEKDATITELRSDRDEWQKKYEDLAVEYANLKKKYDKGI